VCRLLRWLPGNCRMWPSAALWVPGAGLAACTWAACLSLSESSALAAINLCTVAAAASPRALQIQTLNILSQQEIHTYFRCSGVHVYFQQEAQAAVLRLCALRGFDDWDRTDLIQPRAQHLASHIRRHLLRSARSKGRALCRNHTELRSKQRDCKGLMRDRGIDEGQDNSEARHMKIRRSVDSAEGQATVAAPLAS
jgi:hypothetical protein